MIDGARPLATAVPSPRPPTPGAPEKSAVRSMFDRIAPSYDLLNRLLSAGTDVRWRRACVDALGVRGASRILDLCTGTGDLLIEALSRGEGPTGVGIDLSTEMLSRGRRKLDRRGLGKRASMAAGDAERLPLQGACCDGAVVAFGIRNVGDVEAALAEVWRILKPGGRFVILEFSMPSGVLARLYRFYFRRVLPTIGGWISGDPGAYAYLPASVEHFPPPAEIERLLEKVGFTSVRRAPLTAGIAQLYSADRAR